MLRYFGNFQVDNKVRKDHAYPAGIMDVLSIDKTNENFRVLYDVKGRFILRKIKAEEAKFKLCKIKSRSVGPNKVPYVVTHDGRTFRYPDPSIKVGDSVKLNLKENKLTDVYSFELGATIYIQSGNNIGRVGALTTIDKHPGSFDIVHVKDTNGVSFSTRIGNAFVVGNAKQKPVISLPKDNGIYLTALEKKQESEKKH
jgi:small subunit ribosomal protein S4e